MDKKDTVLIALDLQEPFLRFIFERERVVANSVTLIRAARLLLLPVISTLQYPDRMGDMVPEILEALPDYERTSKTTFSACGVKAFVRGMADTGKTTALVCGVESHICVSQTVHDLLAAGYKVHVAADAVSSRTEANWKIGLDKMRGAGAVITSVEAALYEMLVDSKSPEFKQILDLVK
ncbi:MAG: isochorismatase family protein [Armatimonadota bacterium]|nr:isochorismatase family protein [Armatimonadota bacterium]